jgi:F-type H+-transporting ATPase subunit epsilon
VPETLELEILTPGKQIFSGEVASLSLESERGLIEVHPGHAAMVALVGIGVVNLVFPGDFGFGVAVHRGIMKVEPGNDEQPHRVQILASEGEHPEQIDIERAEQALERAEDSSRLSKMEKNLLHQIFRDRLRAEARIDAYKSFRRSKES